MENKMMSEVSSLLNDKQIDVANALNEWRDAGGPIEDVVLSIQKMVLDDMRYVFADFSRRARNT